MDSQTPIKLVAEELTEKQHKRFLVRLFVPLYTSPLTYLQVVTREVAKDLCQKLSQDKKRDKYFWNHASLTQQDEAIREVNASLAVDGFAVAEDAVGNRIQTSMKSYQRRERLMCHL